MKRAALINDLSGVGRCSLSVALPIVSACGHECAVLPTALLSNHTGFENYTFLILPSICAALSIAGSSLEFPLT